MIKRRKTKVVKIGSLKIGGNFPILVQSMTNTPTSDVDKTVQQIKRLEKAGCEIIRVGKNQVVFGGNYFSEYLPPSRGWLVWDKVVRAKWPDGELAWTSFDKGLKIFQYSRADAYINSIKEKQHPTQKPIALMKWILENYTEEGDTIFDPFMGSGTTGVACVQTERNFIGCEIDPDYFKIAERRIHEAQQQMRLPI